jgi:outer membrane protein assembly factor BamB
MLNSARKYSTAIAVVFMLNCGAASFAQPGPVQQWHFQSGKLSDRTIKPDHGTQSATIVGPLKFSSDAPYALVFDGSEKPRHFVSVTSQLENLKLPKEHLTVEAWVLVDRIAEWGGICGIIQDNGDYERGWLLGFRKSQFFFGLTSEKRNRLTYLTDSKAFEPGYWYHVVGTYDGTHQRLFVDGKLRTQSKHQIGPIAYPPKGTYTIGGYFDDNEFHPLTGQIERVSVFDRALTGAQIGQRFNERNALFPGIHATAPKVAGWPTYMRDSQRTGISQESLQLPLHLQWVYEPSFEPEPAWPPPAKTDFWNRKYNLKPRVIFDRAFQPVSVDDRVYFGSSADDKVYCLDAKTGAELWSFFAEAPVRLAPTIADGKVLFGADDGCVYCLDAKDGALLWNYRADAGNERQIPGNGRVISTKAIRTGILVEGDTAFFCAGIFPQQGVYQLALDIKTGKKIDSAKVNVAAQGYLERRSGQLYVPAGRNPAGVFASSLQRRGKGVGKETSRLSNEFPFSFIGSKSLRFGGGDCKVAAFSADDGKRLWQAEVFGRAYGLAIADGRLLVSTDRGNIYCFSSAEPTSIPPRIPPKHTPLPKKPVQAAIAKTIVETSGTTKGYCLVIGKNYEDLLSEIAYQSEFKIIAFDTDKAHANQMRQRFAADELCGQVSVHYRADSSKLPYTDYMFNLVVATDSLDGKNETKSAKLLAELHRVSRPATGIVFDKLGQPTLRRKPLTKIGEWSHMYGNAANTSCSTDQRVQGRMALQWFGEPGPREMLNRHHRTVAPLWKNGRLIIPGDDQIFAADAYNGTQLWHVKIPNSRRIGAFRDCSYLVAGDHEIYVAADNKCLVLDASTGQKKRTLQVPAIHKTHKHEWGYLANIGNLVVGSGVKPGASRRAHTRESIDDTYFDTRAAVCSDTLFAMENLPPTADPTKTAQGPLWTYQPSRGAIINSTISIADQRIVFVESNQHETLADTTGRNKLPKLLKDGAELVALNLTTGKVLWRSPAAFTELEHNVYTCIANDKVAVVGSRNLGTGKAGRLLYDIHVLDAKTGKPIWNATQDQKVKIGGSHGEQDLHPVVVDNRLYCEPYAYDLTSGRVLSDWGWKLGKRRGCGTISASAASFFFRNGTPTMFDLNSKTTQPVTTATRPGCLINIIPAGGLLLIPEASSGCTCDYAVQTSLAFLPIPE